MTRAIMLQGTGSDVGKSVLVAGLCRLARNRGLEVRPFKPQNMSNNAAVSDDGGEIGRAQWLQALACRIPSSVHMNPVLLKPQSETGSQIIVQGKVWGQARGRDYQKLKEQLLDAVMESWDIVCNGADLVIVEGAGSPAEINLRAGDIANMGFAKKAGVPVVLVGDIDRGGVIASIVGTHVILEPEDRDMIIGFVINKFRGDISLFDDGLKSITSFTGWPSYGVVPWLKDASRLPAEDSVALERLVKGQGRRALKIAVPVLDRIANFDDFDPLMAEPQVELVMVRSGERLPADAGLVIIPGSKSTISDLVRFRENGWDRDLDMHRRRGGHIIGICGGYQMLGRTVRDPDGIEGSLTETDGLGYLDIDTVMEPGKTVRNVEAHSLQFDLPLKGYEIHLGHTTGPDCVRPAVRINGVDDGAMSADGKIFGTYMHGLFGDDAFRAALLGSMGFEADEMDYHAGVDAALDSIAAQLAEVLDIEALLGTGARR
jgi:adenosylcobyric acid synthase